MQLYNPSDKCEINLYICSGYLLRISEHKAASVELRQLLQEACQLSGIPRLTAKKAAGLKMMYKDLMPNMVELAPVTLAEYCSSHCEDR